MQPTDQQIERSLRALRQSQHRASEAAIVEVVIPEGVLEALRASPSMRLDRVADAKLRLQGEQQPTDDDLARRLVGRLVCDRLR